MSETSTDPASSLRRPLFNALLVAAVSIGAALLGLTGMWDMFRIVPERPDPLVSLVFALPGCVALVFKQRRPGTVLVIVSVLWLADIVTVSSLGALIVVADALWTATRYGSETMRRRILVGIIIVLAILTVATIVRTRDFAVIFVVVLSLAAVFGTTYWAAAAVGRATELAQMHRRERVAAAVDAERERGDALRREREVMARELHDLVAGHVSAVALSAEAAMLSTPEGDEVRPMLRSIRSSSLQAHDALRSMIAVLRAGDAEIAAPDRWDIVDDLVRDARGQGVEVRVTGRPSAAMSLPVEQTVVRIVRESLANAVRHSPHRTAHVVVDDDTVMIRTGGTATRETPIAGNGWGLQLLAERVRALGGTFTAGPEGGDWVVRAVFPRIRVDEGETA